MTISESIIDYLGQYEEAVKKADTDQLESQSVSYGLSKEPSQNVKTYLSGRKVYTDYYEFMARLDNKTNPERISNHDFFEKIASWLEEQNVEGNLPALSDGLVCSEISISVPFHMVATGEDTSVYAFTIKIVYEKER